MRCLSCVEVDRSPVAMSLPLRCRMVLPSTQQRSQCILTWFYVSVRNWCSTTLFLTGIGPTAFGELCLDCRIPCATCRRYAGWMPLSWEREQVAASPECLSSCAKRVALRRCILWTRRGRPCLTGSSTGCATRPRCRRGMSESTGAAGCHSSCLGLTRRSDILMRPMSCVLIYASLRVQSTTICSCVCYLGRYNFWLDLDVTIELTIY